MALLEAAGWQLDTQSSPVQAQRLSVRLSLEEHWVGFHALVVRRMEEAACWVCPALRGTSRQDKENSVSSLGMQKLQAWTAMFPSLFSKELKKNF